MRKKLLNSLPGIGTYNRHGKIIKNTKGTIIDTRVRGFGWPLRTPGTYGRHTVPVKKKGEK